MNDELINQMNQVNDLGDELSNLLVSICIITDEIVNYDTIKEKKRLERERRSKLSPSDRVYEDQCMSSRACVLKL